MTPEEIEQFIADNEDLPEDQIKFMREHPDKWNEVLAALAAPAEERIRRALPPRRSQ